MLQFVIQQDDGKRFLSTERLGTEAIATPVDGELSVVAEHRTQTHLMVCSEYRREVAKQRQAVKCLRDNAPLRIPVELRARIVDLAGSCEDSEPCRSTRHLMCHLPESLSAALEQIVRGLRKGGSHQWADIALSMTPRSPWTPIMPP